jgi:3-dehydroquinate synthetase/predicted NBD/HSP70 family sugar kinase
VLIVLDLGGTWFRSGVVDHTGELRDVRRIPALGRCTDPDASGRYLQRQLMQYVLDEVATRRAEYDPTAHARVGISLGAAVHGTSGLVLASAPLWGPDATPFDFTGELCEAQPDVSWTIVNDVSAAAMAFAGLPWGIGAKKLAAVTLSTGIALRTIEVPTGRIATDRRHGMQGEIGHVPVEMSVGGRRLSLPCDCGAADHLSAFLSGRGIPQVLAAADYAQDAANPTKAFAAAAQAGVPAALALLDGITLPLARILLDLAVLDPECELVVLHGGVAAAFGEPLRASVVQNLNWLGLYGVSDRDPGFFDHQIRLAIGDDFGLRGAARAASLDCADVPSRPNARTWRVTTEKQVSYDVRLIQDILDPANCALAAAVAPRPTRSAHVVVVDRAVAQFHRVRIREYFAAHALDLRLIELEARESTKTIDEVMRLVREFSATGMPRRGAPIVAIGGGVTLDMVGLSASLFRRGTPYVRVPTTLVALIDAGIGAKTAANVDGQKSRIGTYHASTTALLDLAFLITLDRRQIASGLAEAVKIALVKDCELFDVIGRHAESVLDDAAKAPAIDVIVRRSVTAMLEELASNLWEDRLERLPDFGHSFSPAIEMHAWPPLLHGEAVGIDIAISSLIARNRGLLSPDDADCVLAVLAACELPRWHADCTIELLADALTETTRHRGGYQRLPLLTGIGSATFVNDVDLSEIAVAAEELAALALDGGN